MAAELVIMHGNEQIDAMKVMAVNPFNYLIAPRRAAGLIMVPILSRIFVLSSVLTSFFVGIGFCDVDARSFTKRISVSLSPGDVFGRLITAFVFGFVPTAPGITKG